MAATSRLRPPRQASTANSTIRMAFLAARPTRVTRATWKYTSLDRSRSQVATRAPNTPKGTAVSTASGSDQLSYWAARIRKTMTSASTKMTVVSALASFSCRAEPTQPRP